MLLGLAITILSYINEPATTELWYGTHKKRINSVSGDTTMVAGHSVTLSNLQGGKTYHYYIVAVDDSGNQITTNTMTFTTVDDNTGGSPGNVKCTPGAKKKGKC